MGFGFIGVAVFALLRFRFSWWPLHPVLFLMWGTYVRENYGSRYYGKAINIVRRLRAAYDEVLAKYDLLLMPTTPMKATPLPKPDASREIYVERALEFFGPGRMMFGSDWPVCLLAASHDQVLESFQLLLAGLGEEDRNRIFAENASEFYRLRGETQSADTVAGPSVR